MRRLKPAPRSLDEVAVEVVKESIFGSDNQVEFAVAIPVYDVRSRIVALEFRLQQQPSQFHDRFLLSADILVPDRTFLGVRDQIEVAVAVPVHEFDLAPAARTRAAL